MGTALLSALMTRGVAALSLGGRCGVACRKLWLLMESKAVAIRVSIQGSLEAIAALNKFLRALPAIVSTSPEATQTKSRGAVNALALPTTSSIADLYATSDQVAIATLLANKAVERSMQAKLEDARDAVTNKIVDILGTYKATMTAAGSGPTAQLLISEHLKMLPLLLLGLLKHVGLRQSSQIPSDMRAYAQSLLTTLPSQLLVPYLYPTFYSLHNMPKECGTLGDYGVILPPQLNATSERLERHGLFLIEDSQNIFLWVGREAVPQLIADVFDLPSYQDLRGGKTTLPILDNPFSQRISAIVGKIREYRRGPYYPHLYVVKEDGEPSLRMWALSLLVEDRQESLPSYHQFITSLKDKVNNSSF